VGPSRLVLLGFALKYLEFLLSNHFKQDFSQDLGAFTYKTGTFIPPSIDSTGLHIFRVIPVAV
jgi:hypothetical protein